MSELTSPTLKPAEVRKQIMLDRAQRHIDYVRQTRKHPEIAASLELRLNLMVLSMRIDEVQERMARTFASLVAFSAQIAETQEQNRHMDESFVASSKQIDKEFPVTPCEDAGQTNEGLREHSLSDGRTNQ